jgi:hypothetical protein
MIPDVSISHRIHGAAIYGVPWIPSRYPLYVSIYTSTMDPLWVCTINKDLQIESNRYKTTSKKTRLKQQQIVAIAFGDEFHGNPRLGESKSGSPQANPRSAKVDQSSLSR